MYRSTTHICLILATVVIATSTFADPNTVSYTPDANDLPRCIEQLAARPMNPPPEELVQQVAEHGTAAVNYIYDNIQSINNMAAHYFCTDVIPKLPPAETSAILLSYFQQNAGIIEELHRLQEMEKTTGRSIELQAAANRIRLQYARLNWTLSAIANLAYNEGYDQVYAVYMRHTSIKILHHSLSRALHSIDPPRAISDFTKFTDSTDDKLRLKGIASLRQINHVPPCDLLETLLGDTNQLIRQEAVQLIYRAPRDCLDLLIKLCKYEDEQIRMAADYGLRSLSKLPVPLIDEMFASATTPQEAAELWHKWWGDNKDLTNDQLIQQGLELALKMATQAPDPKLLSYIANLPNRPEVYPVIEQCMTSTDAAAREAALGALYKLAWSKDPKAIDLLFEWCGKQPLADTLTIADKLARIRDQRTVPTLTHMLQQTSDRSTSYKVLRALGLTEDAAAAEPLIRWFNDHSDGSEQAAAQALAELPGVEPLLPQLVTRLINEPDHNKRTALTKTIQHIAGRSLPALLIEALPKTMPGDNMTAGNQTNILQLMESFPDPAAKPLLLDLLKSDNCFSRLHAARALAKLNDYSGLPVLLDDLFITGHVAYHFYAYDVGQAVKDINAPGTRTILQDLFHKTTGQDQQRVLHVIGQQQNQAYLPFLDEIISTSTQLELKQLAALAVSSMIYYEHNDDHTPPPPLDNAILEATKLTLNHAFNGVPLGDNKGNFPDHSSLTKIDGAVLKLSDADYLLYKSDTNNLRRLDATDPEDAKLVEQARPRNDDTLAYGKLHWQTMDNYLSLTVRLDFGSQSYLFRKQANAWTIVTPTGGLIE